MIPLYGFLQGDTMGLLVLAEETDTATMLVQKLVASAGVRVHPTSKLVVVYKGHPLEASMTVARAGIEALERIDVVKVDSP
jgi:Toluene-4-monooxygenase system protein B (TmoB)